MAQELCASNSGDGCGSISPHKSTSGLCVNCEKLSELEDGTPAYNQWKSYQQCIGCGMAWKNLSHPICGCCKQLHSTSETQGFKQANCTVTVTSPASGTLQQATDVAQQHIAAAIWLLTAKANIAGDPNKVFITISGGQVTTPSSHQQNIDPDLGSWGCSWSKSDYMTEVLNTALITLNSCWAKTHGMELEHDEVELCWTGNKIFLSGTANGTVKSVYKQYMTGEMAAFYAPSDVKTKHATGGLKNQQVMSLKIYIDKGKLSYLCTNKASDGLSGTVTKIQFTKANLVCDSEMGLVNIMWPESVTPSKTQTGYLGTETFVSRATKNVYELTIGSDLFVTKQFSNIDIAPTWDNNCDFLRCELIHLKTLDWFWSKFKQGTKENHMEVSSGKRVIFTT
ncbi:hypothetical protein P691DRAFT_764637 [Macrolepiota fuliginosa MF-IS2]|uniref:Uncharacterized protein n=1 Tax=Macrolepiota fuliginosa MF-IS2 TaxID=1400762 RepID=A0A9P5X4G8_9AGAR|nr:hypothetical protein P691DRAFT_764637 [Macrolepiota fuliginosa MF-IS2]